MKLGDILIVNEAAQYTPSRFKRWLTQSKEGFIMVYVHDGRQMHAMTVDSPDQIGGRSFNGHGPKGEEMEHKYSEIDFVEVDGKRV